MGKHAQSSTVQASIQYGAEGSVLRNVPSKPHPAEALLKQAVWWIDAAHESAGSQTITNLGWGGSALNATAGSSGSADSNDPKFLDWTGGNYVYLPGVSGNYLSVPDEAALDITGDIDVRVRLAADDWTPSGILAIAGKNSGAGSRSWSFDLTTTGKLRFYWSADGTNQIVNESSAAVPFTDGASGWVRATLDVDTGSGYLLTYYTSLDGVTWAVLGTTFTGAATSIFSGAAFITVGYMSGATALPGSFYRAQILNGIDGTTVLDIDCSLLTSGSATSFTARTGQTVTINRSTSGRKAVAVTQPCWLFGTDDYLTVSDSDLLDMSAGQDFTVVGVGRRFGGAAGVVLSKQATLLGSVGYAFHYETASRWFNVYDGSGRKDVLAPVITDGGIEVLVGRRQSTSLNAFVGAVSGATVGQSGDGNVANSVALVIGSQGSVGNLLAFEGIAFAVFRKALTQYEIELLNDYYQARGL